MRVGSWPLSRRTARTASPEIHRHATQALGAALLVSQECHRYRSALPGPDRPPRISLCDEDFSRAPSNAPRHARLSNFPDCSSAHCAPRQERFACGRAGARPSLHCSWAGGSPYVWGRQERGRPVAPSAHGRWRSGFLVMRASAKCKADGPSAEARLPRLTRTGSGGSAQAGRTPSWFGCSLACSAWHSARRAALRGACVP